MSAFGLVELEGAGDPSRTEAEPPPREPRSSLGSTRCACSSTTAPGTGEPLQIALRPGNAGSNTAQDHIDVVKAALKQLPFHQPGTRPGRKVLVRIDGAGSTHALLDWMSGQRLSYSVGFGLPDQTPDLLQRIPENVWTPAYDAPDERNIQVPTAPGLPS